VQEASSNQLEELLTCWILHKNTYRCYIRNMAIHFFTNGAIRLHSKYFSVNAEMSTQIIVSSKIKLYWTTKWQKSEIKIQRCSTWWLWDWYGSGWLVNFESGYWSSSVLHCIFVSTKFLIFVIYQKQCI